MKPLFVFSILFSFSISFLHTFKTVGQHSTKADYFYGLEAYQKNDYSTALKYLDQAISNKVLVLDAHILKGQIRIKLNDYVNAFENFEKAIEINPKYPKTYKVRGEAYLLIKKLHEAFRDFQKYYSFDQDQEVLESQINIAMQLKDYKMTGKLLKEKYKSSSVNGKAENIFTDYLIEHFILKGDTSIISYTRSEVEKLKLNDAFKMDAFYKLGQILYIEEKFPQALQSFDQALKYKNNDSRVYNQKGICLMKMYQHREAFMAFKKAIALKNDHYEYYKNRGIALYQTGRYRQSISDFSIAKDLLKKQSIKDENTPVVFNDQKRIELLILEGMSYYGLQNRSQACNRFTLASNTGNTQAVRYLNKYCSN